MFYIMDTMFIHAVICWQCHLKMNTTSADIVAVFGNQRLAHDQGQTESTELLLFCPDFCPDFCRKIIIVNKCEFGSI